METTEAHRDLVRSRANTPREPNQVCFFGVDVFLLAHVTAAGMLYRPDPASRSATRVVFAVLCAHLSSASASRSTAWPTLPGSQCASAVRELTAVPTCLLVDANNVRGATAFRLTTGALVDLAEAWAHSNGLRGRVHLVWDHGCKPDALTSRGLEHVFAGPRQSADDMIAAQVPLLLKGGERVCVVTADRELIFRAKHAAASSGAGRGALRLLGTWKFVAMLRHGREAAECAQEEASGGEALEGEHALRSPVLLRRRARQPPPPDPLLHL